MLPRVIRQNWLTRCGCYPNVKTALTWCYCSSWTSSWSCRWAPPCPWFLASHAAADKSREVRGVSQQQQPRANNKLTVRHRDERGLSVSEEHCADTTAAKRKRGKYFVLSGTGFCGNANVTLRGEPSASLALNRFPGRWGEGRGGGSESQLAQPGSQLDLCWPADTLLLSLLSCHTFSLLDSRNARHAI